MLRIITFIVVAMLSSMSDRVAWGADTPQTFQCQFREGGAWTYEAGKYISKGGQPLEFQITNSKTNQAVATLKTNDGSTSLKRVAALDASHYLEVTVGGYLNITTIFDQTEANAGYPAVHSRHLGILGRPIVSQYRGICRPLK